jgi:hypothetical protein
MSNHVQCQLSRGSMKTTTWIPEQFAVVGKHVDLGVGAGRINGWRIDSTGAIMESKVVNERGQDYKRTRQASDI